MFLPSVITMFQIVVGSAPSLTWTWKLPDASPLTPHWPVRLSEIGVLLMNQLDISIFLNLSVYKFIPEKKYCCSTPYGK